MAHRLPVPGSDDNVWGDILNDYLLVEHNADGSQKTLAVSKGGTGATDAATARSNLGAVASTDSRLTDDRTPLDGSVTDAKISSSAAIAKTKLASSVQTSLTDADSTTQAFNASLPLVPVQLQWVSGAWQDASGNTYDNSGRAALRPHPIYWLCPSGEEPVWGSNDYDANTTYGDLVNVSTSS
ncbi:MAG TPA: hypothetical protein VHD84_01970 [Candidatus Saccharimonadales bacterium]|nr:hypothetical protein [Candidatus Saccharimonadales bacterium]